MKRNTEIVQWRKLKRGIKKDGTNNTPVLIFEIYYQGFIVIMNNQNVDSCTHHKYSNSIGHMFNASVADPAPPLPGGQGANFANFH